MRLFISAYTLAPSSRRWDAVQEADYYQGLKTIDGIDGLEIPIGETFHPFDENWFVQHIDPSWTFVVTAMPGVMANMAANPHCGIASQDAEGQKQAVDFYHSIQQSITRLNKALGRSVVEAVQIHTAPNRNKVESSVDALVSSLTQIASWDWGGALLVIEHCDAAIDDKPVEKGFLTLADEIQAVNRVNQTLAQAQEQTQTQKSRFSISVNWGRSAIESQSVDGPLDHIEELTKENLLYGVAYSGVSDQDGAYGAWQDTHMPFAPCPGITDYADSSLLTLDQLKRCLLASKATHNAFVGLKIAAQPNTLDVVQRITYYRDACEILKRATA